MARAVAQAALLLSLRPEFTSEQVKSLIRNTARSIDSVNPDYKGRLGKGLIDIDASIKAAMK